ncbi:MAG: (2Fe-2S)-binding protein [Myxococcota bacterium]
MLICHCNSLCDREIRAAIQAGADTVEAVGAACGAGTCCGGCEPMIERLLRLERRGPTTCAPSPKSRSAA